MFMDDHLLVAMIWMIVIMTSELKGHSFLSNFHIPDPVIVFMFHLQNFTFRPAEILDNTVSFLGSLPCIPSLINQAHVIFF